MRPIVAWIEDSLEEIQLLHEALGPCAGALDIRPLPNVTEGLRFLKRQPPYADAPRPDLLLLDLNLPAISGHRVLELVRADPQLRTLQVVVLTSSCHPKDRRHAEDHGAELRVKPATWAEWGDLCSWLLITAAAAAEKQASSPSAPPSRARAP